MKYILTFVSIIVLIGCGPKFKAGDCVHSKHKYVESWEDPHLLASKILEVGKNHYHMIYAYGREVPEEYSQIGYVDNTKEKMICLEKRWY